MEQIFLQTRHVKNLKFVDRCLLLIAQLLRAQYEPILLVLVQCFRCEFEVQLLSANAASSHQHTDMKRDRSSGFHQSVSIPREVYGGCDCVFLFHGPQPDLIYILFCNSHLRYCHFLCMVCLYSLLKHQLLLYL
jgi:hypothetical protein